MKNLEQYPIVNEVSYNVSDLIEFENEIIEQWEGGNIRGPVHLSHGNEEQLIEIFKRILPTDYVFSTWRSHYHALLHGVNKQWLFDYILNGRSISVVNKNNNFYSSAIVGGILPISLGVAKAQKLKGTNTNVWVFVGDMTFETGGFYEVHKYARNYDLPIRFVIEDNGVSTNTPTSHTWNDIKRDLPDDVVRYEYESKYPHYGTGKWVVF
jgi:TPP-dependent pyruvate/acetoin dehydrogenase alpha subunit